MIDYKVGMKLWYHRNDNRHSNGSEVTVEKIGNKWVQLSGNNGRVEKDSVNVDGGEYSSPGTLYLNKEEYDNEMMLYNAWRSFMEKSRVIGYRVPKGMTLEKIIAIEKLLEE